MDVFNEELIGFWTSLNKHEVKYIMIGGGQPTCMVIKEQQMILTYGSMIL
jgi:hypothetical protein